MTTPSQRADIAAKYEYIYGNIVSLTAPWFESTTVSGELRYRELKSVIGALWATAAWAMGQPKFPTDAAQQAYYESYGKQTVTWLERDVERTGTGRDRDRANDVFVATTLRTFLAGNDLILDLGCGWGHRMIDLHLCGVNARYLGGDRSDFSRRMVTQLAGLFPGLSMAWFPFDLLDPTFPHASPTPQRVGVYSCHAIEQVEILGPTLVDRLLACYPGAEVTGVHLEPVAWQIEPSRSDEERGSAARRYNKDLVRMLSDHPGIEIIRAEACVFDCHDGMATSCLVWRSKAAA
jgi:hypothetical protein